MIKATIQVEFEIEETVYLKTDPDQNARMVVAYEVARDFVVYKLGFADEYSYHFGYEITRDKRAI